MPGSGAGRGRSRHCVDCGARLVYYPRLSNPKAPAGDRVLTYACPDCTADFGRPKLLAVRRSPEGEHAETVEVSITQSGVDFRS